ncbi:MAG: DEAD/DEAH box helicase family protein, partial [Promicromonosporaceae bacterium]|nr:DEAD/DEAH box helicase family protein [Promicromonosporaceae bacterium]
MGSHLHRESELFIGLYPLLPDATCWWLAADFDGATALLDAQAYVKSAAHFGVPTGLEISQSGRGAHVWTFFDEPVPAADARALGTARIHGAITLRGLMTLASYDRLFPNQDTVPRNGSGVGNLIAAPLNGQRRSERGTTVFLNLLTFEPYDDQWEFLSRLDRLTHREVLAVARKGRSVVVGREVTRIERSKATAIHPQPPRQVRATLSSRLSLPEADLTPALAAALRHSATIRNPGFYEAQQQRRSTWNLPRFIQGFDISIHGDLILPRGIIEQVGSLIEQAGSSLRIDDERNIGKELDAQFLGQLNEAQSIAVSEVLAHDTGILQAPTGSGKTVMACAVIAERSVSTLILISKTALASQWRERIVEFLGIKAGQLGGGRKKLTGRVDIMLLQTLAGRSADEIHELTASYGQVIVDECHHAAAGSYEAVISSIPATWWLGLTATPERKDRLEPVVSWHLGPIRHVMGRDDLGTTDLLGNGATFDRVLKVHETLFNAPNDLVLGQPTALSALGGLIANDPDRNAQIASDIRQALNAGRKCLVLSRRRDHLNLIAEALQDTGIEPLIMRGGIGAKELTRIKTRVAEVELNEPLLLMTTVPYGGEGFDSPVIDTVFLVGPISYP